MDCTAAARVMGNPPWDRMKLQQVEWFAARRPEIALLQRANDRKRKVTALQATRDPLAADYARAAKRAETGVRIARKCGDYPLLSGGDVKSPLLFVERAKSLVKRTGMIGCDPKWCNQAVRRSDLFGLLSLAAAARCRARAFQ